MLAAAGEADEHAWVEVDAYSSRVCDRESGPSGRISLFSPFFPNPPSVIRLVGAVLAEQHDEWEIGGRYMNDTTIRETLIRPVDDHPTDPLDATLPALDQEAA